MKGHDFDFFVKLAYSGLFVAVIFIVAAGLIQIMRIFGGIGLAIGVFALAIWAIVMWILVKWDF